MKWFKIYLILSWILVLVAGCATRIQSTPVLPCSIEEYTDSQHIREVGHGASENLQMARRKSLIDAKMKILSYLLNVPLSSDSIVLLQTDILPFEKECEKVFFNENQYHVYTRLACSKPDEEKLVYYRERFRKYAEEKQNQMMGNQQNYNKDDTVKQVNKSEFLHNKTDNDISPKSDE